MAIDDLAKLRQENNELRVKLAAHTESIKELEDGRNEIRELKNKLAYVEGKVAHAQNQMQRMAEDPEGERKRLAEEKEAEVRAKQAASKK